MLGYEDARKLRRHAVTAEDGTEVGTLEDAFVDHETGRAEWGLVSADALGREQFLVPLGDAMVVDDDQVRLAQPFELLATAPRIDPEGELTAEEEVAAYEHYGVPVAHEHPYVDGIPRDQVRPWPDERRISEMRRIVMPE